MSIEKRIDKILQDFPWDVLVEESSDAKDFVIGVVSEIVQGASYYFKGCPDDFCIQHMNLDCIIFGGTNRLIYRPTQGYYPDRSSCTMWFLANYAKIGRHPQQ